MTFAVRLLEQFRFVTWEYCDVWLSRSSWSGWGRFDGPGGGSADFWLHVGCLDVVLTGEVVGGGGQLEPELIAPPAEAAQLAPPRLSWSSRKLPRTACADVDSDGNPHAWSCGRRWLCSPAVVGGDIRRRTQALRPRDEGAHTSSNKPGSLHTARSMSSLRRR